MCIISLTLSWCSNSTDTKSYEPTPYNQIESSNYEDNSDLDEEYSYDDWYEWAENNDIDSFDDCQDEFWTSDAENWCNEYVKENYEWYETYNWYDCTENCEWHEAGYEWAENNDIDNADDCDWNSNSFIEWCISYAEENY